jgi:sulfate transport system substrate-binding protein
VGKRGLLAEKEMGKGKFQIVTPSLSILAEPAVAGDGEREEARYAGSGRRLFALSLHARSADRDRACLLPSARRESGRTVPVAVPAIPMVTIDKDFGGWGAAQKRFFDDGGVFDRITAKK